MRVKGLFVTIPRPLVSRQMAIEAAGSAPRREQEGALQLATSQIIRRKGKIGGKAVYRIIEHTPEGVGDAFWWMVEFTQGEEPLRFFLGNPGVWLVQYEEGDELP